MVSADHVSACVHVKMQRNTLSALVFSVWVQNVVCICFCLSVCVRLQSSVYTGICNCRFCENEWVYVTLKHDNERNGKRREKGQTPTNKKHG